MTLTVNVCQPGQQQKMIKMFSKTRFLLFLSAVICATQSHSSNKDTRKRILLNSQEDLVEKVLNLESTIKAMETRLQGFESKTGTVQ